MAAPRHVWRCLGRAYAPMCMCMHVHAYMNGRVCAQPAVSVTGVLGTSAWEGVYVTQVYFYTNVHIRDTLTAGYAHVCMYICVYMDACVYGCVYASMILLDALRRCYWGFLSVHACAYACVCVCVCMCACMGA